MASAASNSIVVNNNAAANTQAATIVPSIPESHEFVSVTSNQTLFDGLRESMVYDSTTLDQKMNTYWSLSRGTDNVYNGLFQIQPTFGSAWHPKTMGIEFTVKYTFTIQTKNSECVFFPEPNTFVNVGPGYDGVPVVGGTAYDYGYWDQTSFSLLNCFSKFQLKVGKNSSVLGESSASEIANWRRTLEQMYTEPDSAFESSVLNLGLPFASAGYSTANADNNVRYFYTLESDTHETSPRVVALRNTVSKKMGELWAKAFYENQTTYDWAIDHDQTKAISTTATVWIPYWCFGQIFQTDSFYMPSYPQHKFEMTVKTQMATLMSMSEARYAMNVAAQIMDMQVKGVEYTFNPQLMNLAATAWINAPYCTVTEFLTSVLVKRDVMTATRFNVTVTTNTLRPPVIYIDPFWDADGASINLPMKLPPSAAGRGLERVAYMSPGQSVPCILSDVIIKMGTITTDLDLRNEDSQNNQMINTADGILDGMGAMQRYRIDENYRKFGKLPLTPRNTKSNYYTCSPFMIPITPGDNVEIGNYSTYLAGTSNISMAFTLTDQIGKALPPSVNIRILYNIPSQLVSYSDGTIMRVTWPQLYVGNNKVQTLSTTNMAPNSQMGASMV